MASNIAGRATLCDSAAVGETPSGHRERKKQATRQALAQAALRLAVERGPENVLVADIAAAAGVAPRTFNHYFPSKEAAIVAEGAGRARVLRDALAGRADDEPLWDAIRAAVGHLFGSAPDPDREWVARAQLIKSTPVLRVEQQRSDLLVQGLLATEIARRIGGDADRDLYPHLVAVALTGAVRVAIEHWLSATGSRPASLAATVAAAVDLLADGLPEPDRAARSAEIGTTR